MEQQNTFKWSKAVTFWRGKSDDQKWLAAKLVQLHAEKRYLELKKNKQKKKKHQ